MAISPRVTFRLDPEQLAALEARAFDRNEFWGGNANLSKQMHRAVAWYLATCPGWYETSQAVHVEVTATGAMLITVSDLAAVG
jgi:hypothetical protein